MAPKIPELSTIEFDGSESLKRYCEELRSLYRSIAMELEFSSEAIYVMLAHQKGHPALFGLDVKFKAKMVQRRFKREKEIANGGAVEAVKIWHEYRKQFAEVIQPRKAPAQKKTWAF